MRSATLVVLLAIAAAANAQSPDWVWADRAGGSGTEDAYATATDADGNVFVTGYFTSTSVTFGSTTLTHAAYEDIFLVKYNSAGSVLWARAAGGPGYDEGMGVTTDGDGNVIIVGFFTSPSLDFGGNTITNTGTYYNGFIAKYDPDGNALWARNIGGDALEHFYAVATDADGNIYATGDFSSSNITFGSSTLTHVAYTDAMLVKYLPDGTEQWAVGITGDFGDQGTCVTADWNGNVIVGGFFSSSVLDMDGGSLNNSGSSDGFIAKYDVNGGLLWANGVGGPGSESIAGLDKDGADNVAVTGTFSSESLSIGSTTLSNPSTSEQTLIAKYMSNGVALWAAAASGGGNHGTAVAVDQDGALLVTGYFDSDALSFGSILFTWADPVMDVFVVKCGGDGSFQWATTVGSNGQDQSLGIATDEAGSACITGWFSGTEITFGSTTLTNDPGGDDLFVAKISGTVGIAEGPMPSALRLFPNPASDQFRPQFPKGVASALVTINDGQGKMVMPTVRLFAERAMVDVSALPQGIYEVVVETDAVKRAGRLIIAR